MSDFDRRDALGLAVRSAMVLIGLLTVYFIAPLDERSASATALRVVVALVVLAAVIVTETMAVVRSERPAVRAIRALTVMISLLVVVASATYLTISTNDPAAFTEPLGRVDALYLSMMTLTTVGFGDIGAVSSVARVAVMVQMVFNFVTIGVSAKVVLGHVRRRVDR